MYKIKEFGKDSKRLSYQTEKEIDKIKEAMEYRLFKTLWKRTKLMGCVLKKEEQMCNEIEIFD